LLPSPASTPLPAATSQIAFATAIADALPPRLFSVFFSPELAEPKGGRSEFVELHDYSELRASPPFRLSWRPFREKKKRRKDDVELDIASAIELARESDLRSDSWYLRVQLERLLGESACSSEEQRMAPSSPS
jgi:hypothetical protein